MEELASSWHHEALSAMKMSYSVGLKTFSWLSLYESSSHEEEPFFVCPEMKLISSTLQAYWTVKDSGNHSHWIWCRQTHLLLTTVQPGDAARLLLYRRISNSFIYCRQAMLLMLYIRQIWTSLHYPPFRTLPANQCWGPQNFAHNYHFTVLNTQKATAVRTGLLFTNSAWPASRENGFIEGE